MGSSWVVLLLLSLLCYHVTSFPTGVRIVSPASLGMKRIFHDTVHVLSASTTQENDVDIANTNPKGLLKRDRYVATNRFAVRKDQQAKFEKRWATRKSRLATLPGFKYFHLMRRVNLEDGEYMGGEDEASAQGNYVSFTIWDKKSDFSSWRTGEAFKEAHGGTSIGAFVKTMVSSAMVLRGPPRPAFYDGLMVQSMTPTSIPETEEGWRTGLIADGVHTLPAECFVSINQFFVPPDNAPAFEQRWANRESKLKDCDGFVAFSMLRRDGQMKGHGTSPVAADEPSYLSTTIWRDREAFNNWRTGMAFQQAHGQQQQGKTTAKNSEGSGGPSSSTDEKKKNDEKSHQPPQPLWSKPPVPVFYEGTLVISSADGA